MQLIVLYSLLLLSVLAEPIGVVSYIIKPFQNDFMKKAVSMVIGETCYSTFFLNGELTDVPCLKYSISKGLGYGIVVGSGLMKIPQILKILSSKDVSGLNAISFYMECAAFLPSIVYNVIKTNPFSTYGENVIILIQNFLLVGLYWRYAKGSDKKSGQEMILVTIGFVLFTYVLFICPTKYLYVLPLTGTISAVFARVPQIITNFKQKHTGQLSFITWFLTGCGSAARIFTTLQEVDDPIIASSYIVSTCCNVILVFQILIYWNATKEATKKKQE